MNDTALLATFDESEPARQVYDRLLQAGFKVSLQDESDLERLWFSSPPLAAIHVMVDRLEYVAAKRVMNEWDAADGVLHDAVRCPECHSPRVEFPHLTRRFLTPRLVSLLIPQKFVPQQYYCVDCQYTWPTVEPIETPKDVLGWPQNSKLWHPEAGTSAPHGRR